MAADETNHRDVNHTFASMAQNDVNPFVGKHLKDMTEATAYWKQVNPAVEVKDLGYDMIGIDEGWEGCGLGVHGTQHYANGTPAVRPDFPNLKALVDYGPSPHSTCFVESTRGPGVLPGFYRP